MAVHRRHHAFTDVDGDPHSPILEGFAAVQIGNVVHVPAGGHATRSRSPSTPGTSRPTAGTGCCSTTAFSDSGSASASSSCIFWGNLELVAIAAATHVVTYLLAQLRGQRRRAPLRPPALLELAATNTQWLAWLTAGEGLHNNHHAAPTSARLSFRRGEIDPGWWFIAWARKLRLAAGPPRAAHLVDRARASSGRAAARSRPSPRAGPWTSSPPSSSRTSTCARFPVRRPGST